jgi:hypothetical protein
MTGQLLHDPTDGIWDDGEWISWNYINGHLEDRELRAQFPKADPAVVRVFIDLLEDGARYHALTGRYLEIWGELGELFVELKYGLRRHRLHAAGSDGRIGNDFVEVKTLSPGRLRDHVRVKRAGNFSKLFLVRITENFEFMARMIDRKRIGKGPGTHARVSWDSCEEIEVA